MLSSKFRNLPATVIKIAFSNHNHLYAPTYIHLHESHPSDYSSLKRARAVKSSIVGDLQTPAGRLLLAEIAFVESWLEGSDKKGKHKRKIPRDGGVEVSTSRLENEEREIHEGVLQWYLHLLLS